MSGGFKLPGPQCQVLNWYAEDLDLGTTALTVHHGPAYEPKVGESPGRHMSLGAPRAGTAARPIAEDPSLVNQRSSDWAMIEGDIQQLATFPFAHTPPGREIVQKLRRLQRASKIAYADTVDARGDWDGTTIRVHERFRGLMRPTILELVHEASHAVWRDHHPFKQDERARRKDDIDDEFLAERNQLAVYSYFRKMHPDWPPDIDMESRLRQDDQTLRSNIEGRFSQATDKPSDERVPAKPPNKKVPVQPLR